MLRTITYFILLTLATITFYWSDMVMYGLRQLQGQLHIVIEAVPVEKIMTQPGTPDSIRKKLEFIEEVRRFAMDKLELKNSKNYTTYYDQKGKPAIWVITACEPFDMKAYEWYFPMLGHVSYKGFFVKERGYPEVNDLRKQGYDVEYSPAGGWSTLGFFKDPILSGMLRRNKGQLAELIIHELTHSTVYLKGQVELNENLATFVGERGAEQFLKYKYGEGSKELMQYQFEREDEQVFGDFMVKACNELDTYYEGFDTLPNKAEKYNFKYRKIASIVLRIDSLKLHYPERYHFDLPDEKLPDNTFFMSYQRYRGNLEELEQQFEKQNRNIISLINYYKNRESQ